MRPILILLLLTTCTSAQEKGTLPVAVHAMAEKYLPELTRLYETLHGNPELSGAEKNTAARMARELKLAGLKITRDVGGHGLVAVFENGPGPTLYLRIEMDGLPVTEQTGLPFASRVRSKSADGKEVGVMHASGHDLHMAVAA